MTVFWIVAALFLAGALLFLLPGLLAPGADGAAPARRTALALGAGLPLASVLLYLALGSPQSIAPQLAPPSAAGARHELDGAQMQQRVAALAERMKAEPNNVEGWIMLGRSYVSFGRYADAALALRRASELQPGNPHLLADLADVTGMAQGRRLAGEPAQFIQRALDIDPRHVKALSLAGTAAFEMRDYAAARGYWERVLALLPPDSPMLKSVRGSILEASQLADGGAAPAAMPVAAPAAAVAPAPARAATATAPAAAPAAASLSGEVVIARELAARVASGDTLFVFARAPQGSRMPLAVLRRTLADPRADLRLDFQLDDSMAMTPELRLSGFERVTLLARISRSGSATPQSGDLVGELGEVKPGARGLRVAIDRVVP